MTLLLPQSDLHPPVLGPDLLERPRLFARLDRGLQGQATLVAAPAGYGKTTLLAQWIARQDLPSAWLNVEEGYDDPAYILGGLVAAVSTCHPDCCRDTSSLLSRAAPPAPHLLAREFANELGGLGDFILVLDDCHHVRNQQSIEIIAHLVRHLPRSLHLVLSCRADPKLPLGALRGRGLLNELRASDLRFDEAEAAAYLPEIVGRPLTDAQTTALVERTEGWVAGLYLAALSLAGSTDLERGVQELAGSQRHIADYLLDELIARLEPGIRRYLVQTSILDRLCAPLCQAVVGADLPQSVEGRPILEWLEESNAFTVGLDDRREWFRYHRLFRDLLSRLLSAGSTKEEVAALQTRAGEWLENAGDIDTALSHFFAADRPDLAADAIESHIQEAVDRGQWRTLERWVRRQDPEIVDDRPALVLIHAWLAHGRGDAVGMARYCDQAERLLDLKEPAAHDEALRGVIDTIRSQLSFLRARGEESVSLGRRALSRLPRHHRLARATATLFEGAGLHLLGQNEAAFALFRTGAYGPYGEGLHSWVLIGLAQLAFMTGRVDYAERVGAVMLAQADEQGFAESAHFGHFFLGTSAYLWNRLEVAVDHFGAVDAYVSHVAPAKQCAYGLAWVHQAKGQHDEALAVLDRFRETASELELHLETEVRLLQARMVALAGRPTGEAPLARGALPPADGSPLFLRTIHEFSSMSAIAILLHEGGADDLPACETALERILSAADANGNVYREIQGLLFQAVLFHLTGRRAEAVASLARAVESARPGHIVRLFPETGESLLPLLLAQRDRAGSDAFLETLIASFRTEGPAAATPGRGVAIPDYALECLLTNREVDVLELLVQRMTNKEIARHLVISPATVKRHTLSIYAKLGVEGRREAAVKAKQLGLVGDPR